MQVLYDLVGIKYLYDKIPINKIVLKNLKEYTNNSQYNFDDEINEFTNLRHTILVEQYKGVKERLIKLYKEYLFFFETFKQKKLLKCNKILYTNDIFQKHLKIEYEFEEENIIVLYNIGLLKTAMTKSKNDADDAKLKIKISNEVIEIFHYLFENMNNNNLKGLTDINCVSCYIFLCLSSAYHENIFYNVAITKKYKRNLLTKLAYNIYNYCNNILQCLEGKMIDAFHNSSAFSNSIKHLQHIRNAHGYFFSYVLANKLIFLSVSNYHASLKNVELHEGEDIKVKQYEADNIGEIISRLQYCLGNINKSSEICKKFNLNINLTSIKNKIEKLLEFFDYENTHIYFESIPEYDKLDPLKGTEVIKMQNVSISNIYEKKKISPMLYFLFNEKSKKIYEQYNEELQAVCNSLYKKINTLNDHYKLIKLSHRKNIITMLSRIVINLYNTIKQICASSTVFEEKVKILQNIGQQLQEIIIQADSDLQNENKNHLEFQSEFSHVCRINQDSLNSYNNFLYHLENFKKSLADIQNNTTIFKTFLDQNYSSFQIFDMDINTFCEYIVTQLNHSVDLNVDTIDRDYNHFKALLDEENDHEKEIEKDVGKECLKENESSQGYQLQSSSSICSLRELGIKPVDRPSLNYSRFSNFLIGNNLIQVIKHDMNLKSVPHYNILNKYTNVQAEEKIHFIIIALYFSLHVTLSELFKELNDLKNNADEEFLNMLNGETLPEKLQELLQTQKEKLKEIKMKIDDKIVLLEHEMNTFHSYSHDYNKLDSFKTIDDVNVFVRQLLQMMDKINKLNQAHSMTIKSAFLFRDDVHKYIFMRESERSKIRVQPFQNFHNAGHYY